jgi:hypothetical protein
VHAEVDLANGIALWSLLEIPSSSGGKLVRRGPVALGANRPPCGAFGSCRDLATLGGGSGGSEDQRQLADREASGLTRRARPTKDEARASFAIARVTSFEDTGEEAWERGIDIQEGTCLACLGSP